MTKKQEFQIKVHFSSDAEMCREFTVFKLVSKMIQHNWKTNAHLSFVDNDKMLEVFEICLFFFNIFKLD